MRLKFFTFFSFLCFSLFPGTYFHLLNAQDTLKQRSIHRLQYEEFFSSDIPQEKAEIITGLENLLQHHREKVVGKKIGIITNHTGLDNTGTPIWEKIGKIPDVTIVALFSPEHGLLGKFADGEKVNSEDSVIEQMKLYSLYGKHRKPSKEMLHDIDLLIYDIQDIGVRFYTYISTLGLILESAGEFGIPVLVLDRPNPITGEKIGGPVLDMTYKSFVGFYPIPVQYGLTVGELANMIIGEDWIKHKPSLDVIQLSGWKRSHWYDDTQLTWTPPSPNIPDLSTATVYPGTCFIEATNVSEGRGTLHPFIWIGAPWINGKKLSQELNKLHLPGVVFRPVDFVPQNIPGKAIHPKYEGEQCHGIEINVIERHSFESVKTGIAILSTINSLYTTEFTINPDQMRRLFGSNTIISGMENNLSYEDICQQFKEELEEFNRLRKNYLLY